MRINITIKESVLEDEVFQMIDDGSFIPYNKGIVDFIFFQFDHQGTHTKNDWTVPVKN